MSHLYPRPYFHRIGLTAGRTSGDVPALHSQRTSIWETVKQILQLVVEPVFRCLSGIHCGNWCVQRRIYRVSCRQRLSNSATDSDCNVAKTRRTITSVPAHNIPYALQTTGTQRGGMVSDTIRTSMVTGNVQLLQERDLAWDTHVFDDDDVLKREKWNLFASKNDFIYNTLERSIPHSPRSSLW